jgi:hypothetical protein
MYTSQIHARNFVIFIFNHVGLFVVHRCCWPKLIQINISKHWTLSCRLLPSRHQWYHDKLGRNGTSMFYQSIMLWHPVIITEFFYVSVVGRHERGDYVGGCLSHDLRWLTVWPRIMQFEKDRFYCWINLSQHNQII